MSTTEHTSAKVQVSTEERESLQHRISTIEHRINGDRVDVQVAAPAITQKILGYFFSKLKYKYDFRTRGLHI